MDLDDDELWFTKYKRNYVSKDKIRDAIEEIKKIEDDGYGFVSVNNMKKFEIEVLEDLLKE